MIFSLLSQSVHYLLAFLWVLLVSQPACRLRVSHVFWH